MGKTVDTFEMDKNENYVKIKKRHKDLPSKEFQLRDSLLTHMYKNPDIKSLYNICVSILICLLLNSVATEYATKGTITVGLKIIYGAFHNFHIALLIWTFMFLLSQMAYIGLKTYAAVLHSLNPKSILSKTCNATFTMSTILYYLLLLTIPTYLTRRTNQPIASSLALMMEQVRFLMKVHAYIRTNAPEILRWKPHSEVKLTLPAYKQFLYFLFVPTLIYKDEYPKTKQIKWKFVMKCFVEVFLVIFYMCFVIEKFFMMPFSQTCKVRVSLKIIISQICVNALPGLLLLLCSFYLFQHSWQNAFAEMLKFGDRLFYKDWWTSTTYTRYFRTWNIIVHDWLYTYIYNDFYYIFKSKNIARYTVFFVSAIFHEYILSFSLKMFFPVMFVQFFLIGTLLTLIKNVDRYGNIFLWFTFELGQGIQVSLYALELFARYNCPSDSDNFSTFFVPRLFTCRCYLN